MSASELVVNHRYSHALESQLEIIFKIAEYFKAILLFDKTSRTELHSRLVTVILWKLEYYSFS